MHCAQAPKVCGDALDKIVNHVVSSFDREVSGPARDRLLNYIRLLASTGKTDEQLLALGAAYLREVVEPDRRYSGC